MTAERPKSFWNGWRAADILHAALIVGSIAAAAAVVRERQDQDRRDILRILTAEEAIAKDVIAHIRIDDARQADIEARVKAIEKMLDSARVIDGKVVR